MSDEDWDRIISRDVELALKYHGGLTFSPAPRERDQAKRLKLPFIPTFGCDVSWKLLDFKAIFMNELLRYPVFLNPMFN